MNLSSRLAAFSRQILSRSNLEKVMKEFNMYTEPHQGLIFIEDKIADLKKRISIKFLQTTTEVTRGLPGAIPFTISYEGKNPEKAMKVTNALAAYFIDENTRYRTAEAIGTSDFLSEELNSIRKELVAKEKQQKEYREKYMGELPEQLGNNLNMLTRLQEEIKGKESSLLDAKNKLAMMKDQIKQGALLFGQGVTVNADGTIKSDFEKPISLEQAKAMLSYLETRYTAKHPDIIRIKKIIKDLEQDRQNNNTTTDVSQYIPETRRGIEILRTRL